LGQTGMERVTANEAGKAVARKRIARPVGIVTPG
jgi:hypothetical protein